MKKYLGPAEIRTRVTRFKAWGPDHWTTEPTKIPIPGVEPGPGDGKSLILTVRPYRMKFRFLECL